MVASLPFLNPKASSGICVGLASWCQRSLRCQRAAAGLTSRNSHWPKFGRSELVSAQQLPRVSFRQI